MSNPLTAHARVFAQAIAREMAQTQVVEKSTVTFAEALAESTD